MPPYEWLANQRLLLALGIGLGLTIAVLLARGSRVFGFSLSKKPAEPSESERHEFGGGVSELHRPVPLLVWLVFVGYFVWATAYVLFVAERGI
jgi:hypothetical protein